jgi:hypothetical protein
VERIVRTEGASDDTEAPRPATATLAVLTTVIGAFAAVWGNVYLAFCPGVARAALSVL